MNVLILAHGDPPSGVLLRRLAARHDLLIAVDGAAHAAASRGVAPQIVSGDFDSALLDQARAAFPNAEFIETPDQHLADLEKALHLARGWGASSVTICGAGGGRIDHLLANYGLLRHYGTKFPLAIVEDGSETRALSGTKAAPGVWAIQTRPGDTLSLLPQGGEVVVTARGVRWPLDGFELPAGTQGLSNEATGGEAVVEVRGGVLLVCHLFMARGEER